MFSAMKTPFLSTRNLPEGLTSFDLLKSLALLLMIVDHVGYFFAPDEEWFRVIGRLSVPIWFYLIGYANTRQVQSVIWIGAVVVAFSTIAAGEYIIPLNILFGLALARLWIDRIMVGALRSYEAFAGMFFLLLFLSFPTMMLFEYGTMGFLFTVFGYLRQHKDGVTIKPLALFGFIAATSIYYSVISGLLIPQLDMAQAMFLFAGVFCLSGLLFLFEGREYTALSQKMDALLVPIKIMGRHTLFIYVVHLLVFRAIILFSDDDRFGFFDVEIMPPAFAQIIQSFIG